MHGSRVLLGLLVAALLFGASTEALDRLREYHVLRDVGLRWGGVTLPSTWFFAGLALLGQLVGFIVTEPLRRRVDPADPTQAARALRGLTLAGIAALLVFAGAPNLPLVVLALTATDVLRGLYTPISHAWLNQGLASGTRATVLSLAGQADALGQIAFGPVMGAPGSRAGVPWALAASALVRLPMLLIFRTARPKVPNPAIAED